MRFIEILGICVITAVFILGIYDLSKAGLSEKEMECLERLNFCQWSAS